MRKLFITWKKEMKTQKFRGIRSKAKNIQKWVDSNCNLNLIDSIKKYQGWYTKIYVDPWFRISVTNSAIPSPPSRVKQSLLDGLFKIYDSWKEKLSSSGEEHNLRIWLNENSDFMNSQVVANFGESYPWENSGVDVDVKDVIRELNPKNDSLQKIKEFNWTLIVFEQSFKDDESLIEELESFGLTKKHKHRIENGHYIFPLFKTYVGKEKFL